MPLSPELLELRSRLEEAGMIVVAEPNYLTVRLPYFSSVRIFSDNGRLRFEPYLGRQPRTRATVLKLGGLGVVALASLRIGAPYALGMVAAALMFGIYDVFRVVITESVITRASVIYSQMRQIRDVAFEANGLSADVNRARELNAGSGALRAHDELPRQTDSAILKRT